MSAQLLTILVALIFRAVAATAEEPEASSKTANTAATKEKKYDQSDTAKSYVDKDRDGRNDHFLDADGDGKNDISGKPYPHRFRFIDKDGDGKNDVFRDQDGDGVNDLSGAFVDLDWPHEVGFCSPRHPGAGLCPLWLHIKCTSLSIRPPTGTPDPNGIR